jgi:hypothetical protein
MLTVRGNESTLKVKPELNTVGYPLPRDGALETSEDDLQRIWQACAWTQQICSLDAYVDTPWREQAQWWGDARVQAWNTFHLCNDARLLRRGIAQIGSQTTPGGVTYGHAPTMAHTCVLPDFTLIWMLTQWDHYWQTGSLEAFQSHRETTARALEYFRSNTNPKNGLVGYDERYWLFLDWTGLPREGYPTLLNLWLLIALDELSTLHQLSGDGETASTLTRWSDALRVSLSRLINEHGLISDGIASDGKPFDSHSMHAQTLALMAKLDGINASIVINEKLLPFLRREKIESEDGIVPSSYWVTYVLSLLSLRGYGEDVVAFIRRHWQKMAAYGTTFEAYEESRIGESHSHAWSAHPLFHLMQTLGGVTQSETAWKKVRFAPVFIGKFAEARFPTPQGEIAARWQKDEADK